jgi:CBS domain-containing protein
MTTTDRDGEQVSQQDSAGAVQGAGAHDKAAHDKAADQKAADREAVGEESARATRAEGDDPRVADIMERDVVTIAPDATVHELVLLLRDKDLGGVPVVDGNRRLVGIVTEGDLVIEDADVRLPHYFELFGNLVYLGGQKKFEERLKKMVGNAVADVMTTEVFTVGPDDPAPRAANIMVDKKVNRVPVVDGDSRLVGIVARHDIIRMLGL